MLKKENFKFVVSFKNGKTYEEVFKTKEAIDCRLSNYLFFARKLDFYDTINKIEVFNKTYIGDYKLSKTIEMENQK